MLHDVWLSAGWLWLKLALLPVYVVLGSFALKRGRTRVIRLATYLAALAVFLSMYSIARGQDPLAPVRLLG
ncbi:MAG: SirB2 family protein, partial [Pseudomonadota bacterium]